MIGDEEAGVERYPYVCTGGRKAELMPLVEGAEGWSPLQPNAINDDGTMIGVGRVGVELRGDVLVPLRPLHPEVP